MCFGAKRWYALRCIVLRPNRPRAHSIAATNATTIAVIIVVSIVVIIIVVVVAVGAAIATATAVITAANAAAFVDFGSVLFSLVPIRQIVL